MVRPAQGTTVEHDGGAHARPDRDEQRAARPGRRAEPDLAGGVRVDVVLDEHRHRGRVPGRRVGREVGEPTAQAACDVGPGPAGQGVGRRDDDAATDVDHPGGAHAERAQERTARQRGDDLAHEPRDGVEHRVGAGRGRRRHGAHGPEGPVGRDRRRGDLGATEVDPDDDRARRGVRGGLSHAGALPRA